MSDKLTQDLISRALAGDEHTLAALFDSARPAVRATLRSFQFQPAELEDVIQDVFIAVWKHLRSFRGDSRFTTWCCAIAKNEAINRAKRLRC